MTDKPANGELTGWDGLAVGRRQAALFITFGGPLPGRAERTLWIDTSFRVTSAAGDEVVGTAAAGTGLEHLEPLVLTYVEDVVLDQQEVILRFEQGVTLRVANEPDAPESSGWWITSHPGAGD